MNSIRLSWLTLVAVALLASSACQSGPPDPTSTTSDDPRPSRVGPDEELSGAIDQLRLGFKPDDEGFRAGAATHDAAVSGGDLVLVPHDFDGGRAIDGAPVRFSTAAIQRDDLALAAGGVPTARLRDDSAVAIARGPVTELVANRDDGVEQSWRFAAAPGGEGDLLVAVAVSGHQQVSTSRRGLHFLSGDRLGFSYSHATWVDATRAAWDIPVSWDGSRIVMRVPASVLDRSSYPAVLDPVIGPERGVDLPVDGYPGGAASQPQIARGSSGNFLIVWTDDRNGNERETEIWASRVSSTGKPLDPRGIAIAHSTILEHEPAVAWTGSEWLVAWTREDATNAAIAAATVSTTGVVTDLGIIAGTTGFESEAALASGGDGNALLVYNWNHQIRAMRYSAGAFAPHFTVSADAQFEGTPTVAASGSNYLVAWQLGDFPGQDIYGRIINLSGTSPPAFAISSAPDTLLLPAATFDGTDYVVAWWRAGDIWGARVTTAGAVLDSTGGVGGVALAATPNGQTDPAIECTSSSCLLAWADARDTTDPSDRAYDLIAQRLAFDLSPIGGEITVGSYLRNQYEPTLTTIGSSAYLAAWRDARAGTGVSSIFASKILSDGTVASPDGELVNVAVANAQNRPAYAVGATTELAVWSDSRSFGDDIMGVRYDGDGSKIDTTALTISGAQWDQTGPAVAFDGSQYVVAWRDMRNPSGDIFAARLAENGTLSDPSGIAVTTADFNQVSPDVASNGSVSLIAWADRRTPANSNDLLGAILAADGTLVASDIEICRTTDEQVNASVAWDPNSSLFVVAWSDRRADGRADIYAARVEPDGTVLDPCGVPICAEPTNWQTSPDVAVSGGQLLIVWADYRDDFFGDIFGGRITVGAGGITRLDGDGVPIATGVSWQTTPVAVGVGLGRWGIAWTDTINEATAGTDILGNTMQADGTLEPQYVLSGGIYFETGPAFQSGGGDSNVVSLLYEWDRPSTGRLRVRRRQITY